MSRRIEGLVMLTVACLFAAWLVYYRFDDPLAPKFHDSTGPQSLVVTGMIQSHGIR